MILFGVIKRMTTATIIMSNIIDILTSHEST